jgi:hypothetical protein
MSGLNHLCLSLAYANDWNTTRVLGTLCYTATALLCGMVVYLCAMRRKRHDSKHGMGLWVGLLLCQVALIIELQLSMRFDAGQVLRGIIRDMNLYENRRQLQAMAFAVVSLPMIAITSTIFYLVRRRGIAVLLAVAGTIWSVSLFCLPLISLHMVDQIMYHYIGPVMFISLMWSVGAALTFIGGIKALVTSRNALFALPNQYDSHRSERRTSMHGANSRTSRHPSTSRRGLHSSGRRV